MTNRATWTAPVTGAYHFSGFGTPHLVAECGPHCVSYLELPEGTTVVSFDATPAERPVPTCVAHGNGTAGPEDDDRFEAACEGAYEAIAALWHGAIKGWYPDRTPELLFEAHTQILRAISLAEEQGIIGVDYDGGLITAIHGQPTATGAMPRPFLSAALTEVAPEVIQRFQASWDEMMRKPQPPRVHYPAAVVDFSSFHIGSDSADDSAHWAYVTHVPCGADVFSGRTEPTGPDMGVIWGAMIAHRCSDERPDAPRSRDYPVGDGADA